MYQALKKDLVFVASGGRTATKFFGESLGSIIDNSFSEHEPDTLGRFSLNTWRRVKRFGLYHMLFGKIIGMTGLRSLGHQLLAERISEERCIMRLRNMRRSYYQSISEPLIIESSGRWWMFVKIIDLTWPGAKVIGVIRDPRDWIESWRRHQPNRHNRFFFRWFRWFPQGPLTPNDIGDFEWADRWDSLDIFGRLAWDWRAINSHLHRAACKSENIRLFRFEDIFSGNENAFYELISFAAIHEYREYKVRNFKDVTSKIYNASKGERRSWIDWSDHEVLLVHELCGPLMRKYGYGQESEWLDKIEKAKVRFN